MPSRFLPSAASTGSCYRAEMARGSTSPNLPIFVFPSLTAASLAGLLLLPALPQDQSYHLFADCRTVAGIPNFWNVVSNIPFVAIGAAGLWRFQDDPPTIVLFLGFFLTGIGSSYYHWHPNDATLFWDRLPMTLSFAAILSLVAAERVDPRMGSYIFWPLLTIGLFSLVLWRWIDDLRLYFWAQFFPGLALLLLLALYPPKYSGTCYWIIAVALYALAKVFEFSDYTIFSAGYLLSGHTLKHLTAAAGCFAILRYLQTRRPLP